MTIEEAIQVLKQEREDICSDTQCLMTAYRDFEGVDKCNIDCELREAYDMAIKSLQKDIERHKMVIRASERHLNIVRCKDCRHAYYADNRVPHEKIWVCERFMNEEITSNDFCSWGERKGGDTE